VEGDMNNTRPPAPEGAVYWEPCRRCGGDPNYWSYTRDKVCYECNGDPSYGKWLDQKTLDRRAKARARYAAKKETARLAKIAAEQAVFDAWAADHGDIIAMVKRLDEATGARLHSLGFEAMLAMECRKPLSEAMIAAVEKAIAELDAPKIPVPEGKETVTGEIVGIKWLETYYTYSGESTRKMIVMDDRGFKVYGTAPRSLDDAGKGDRVSFTATLQRSCDDPTFGYFKRPTNAQVVEAEIVEVAK